MLQSEDPAAVEGGGQVDPATQEPRIGQRLAVHPEPGDPAVGVDPQPDVAARRSAAKIAKLFSQSPASFEVASSGVQSAARS